MSADSSDPESKLAATTETDDLKDGRVDHTIWLIWGVIMLVAIAILPFAVRNQDVVRAIASMCGFELG